LFRTERLRYCTLFLLLIFIATAPLVSGQMLIDELHSRDPVYRQHQELVASFYRASVQRDGEIPPLIVMVYQPKPSETLFEIASRLMLPYSSISTLNRMAGTDLPDGPILVPSRPGLLVFENPVHSLEEMVLDRLSPADAGAEGGSSELLQIPRADRDGAVLTAVQYPGTDFLPSERQRFLRVVFADPLPAGILSSPYGYRTHPVTGIWSFHYGIDLAGAFGDPVRTAAAGTVTDISRDPWLGLSVVITHPGGYQTRYAHLQEALVEVGTTVTRGATIGAVGSTGLSTGPHLHFEVLYEGENRNPIRYIPREGP
jgi:murein DD-endopeptidase MepM/ murein hydrolase activator NlpD